jgi:hypothetical protein
MKEKNKKSIILTLIKDDLINNKLVNTFNDCGLNADDYCLHLGDTIFKLMDIKETSPNEVIYKNYLNLTKRAKYINISQESDSLENLAEEIYSYLLHEKSNLSG